MTSVGYVHVALAICSMGFGAVIFGIAKGSRLHVYLGRAYVASMLGMNGTAFFIYRLFGGFGPFHVLALVSLMTMLVGYAAVYFRRSPDRWLLTHYRAMSWSYVGLMAAAAAEGIVRIDVLRESITGWMHFGLAVFVASSVVCCFGGWLIGRLEERTIAKPGPVLED